MNMLSTLTLAARVLAFACVANVMAADKATVPTADRPGTKDHPLLKRYEGSYILSFEQKGFADFELPLAPLEAVPGKVVEMNNRAYEPTKKKSLEGKYTRIVYIAPQSRSSLEVLRNYQAEVNSKGGRILFECKEAECGGNAEEGIGGGGGRVSLAKYLYPLSRLTERSGTNAWCAVEKRISNQRYMTAELPAAAAHVSLHTYVLKTPGPYEDCEALNGRTIAVVDIIEGKALEQKMVTEQAEEMAKTISSEGRVALYGIYFDSNKAELRLESSSTLEQIARLLKQHPSLKLLVVGHTDNVGDFPANMELSQRRAASVVAALAGKGIGKERLTPVGVSYSSPVASNKSEEGRSKNRRVELVEN